MPQDPPKKKKLTPAQKAALKKVSSKTKAAKASALARSSKPLDTSPKPSGIGPAWMGSISPVVAVVRSPKRPIMMQKAPSSRPLSPAQKRAKEATRVKANAAYKAAKAKLAARAKKKK